MPTRGVEHLQRFLLLVEATLRLDAQLREFLDLLVEVLELLLADAHFLLRAGDFLPRLVAQRGEFLDAGAVGGGAQLGALDGVAHGGLLVADALDLGLGGVELLARGGDFLFLRGDAGVERFLLLARAVDFDLQRGDAGGVGVELVAREFGLELGQLIERGLVAAGLAGLALERADLPLHFADDVGEADEVGLGVLQLAQRFLFLALEFRDAGGFLENRTAIFRTRREDRVDLALLHDGVGAAADAGVHEHGLDVAQAAADLVELVLAGAVAGKRGA